MVPQKIHPGRLRVLGYTRVSTEEQKRSGAGLAAQRSAISDACKARAYRLLEVIEDGGYSAKNLDRPGITRALEELDAGRADALMVSKLDRLSRSMLDFSGLMDRAQVRGWSIIALDLGVDTSTPAGEMMANVLATFAQFERRLIVQRINEGIAQKKAQGSWTARSGKERTRFGRPTHPKVLEALPDIIEQSRQGWTLQRIADDLNTRGVPTSHGGQEWRPSSVRAVLRGSDAKRLGWEETPRHRHGGRRA